jgi:hypothetical protein
VKPSKSKGLTPKPAAPTRLSAPTAMPTGWVCPKCDGVNAPSVNACPCSTARAPTGPTKNVPPKQGQTLQEFVDGLRPVDLIVHHHAPGRIA